MVFGLIDSIKENAVMIEDNVLFHIFLWGIMLDIFTGLAKSIKENKVNSSIGLNGLIRHMVIIMIVFLISIYLPIYDFENINNWIILYFIIMYAISIFENLEIIGVPLPKWIKTYVTQMHDKMDNGYKLKNVDEVNIKTKSKHEIL